MSLEQFVFGWVGFGIGCFYSVYILFGYMLFRIIRRPMSFFSWKTRDEIPPCLTDPSLGTHSYVYLEEVRLHYVACGDEGKPLMLFVHGFPEFWYSWRYQMKEFQKDYRVVAIDNRGYADSDKPKGRSNYEVSKMVGDLKQLIPALGYKSCVLVSHDWGAAISWAFTAQHPDMVDKLIVMNCPHPDVLKRYMRTSLSQFLKSWYVFFFQVPVLPELLLRAEDYVALRRIFTDKRSGLQTRTMSEEEVEAYLYAMSQPGALSCAINYYRAVVQGRPLPKYPSIQCPVLQIWGCKDVALERSMPFEGKKYVANLTIRTIEEASHWVQVDTPDVVNKHMRDFLDNSD